MAGDAAIKEGVEASSGILDMIPGADVIGGLIGLGTILAGVFGHRHQEAMPNQNRHDPNAPVVQNVATQYGV